MQAVHKHKFKPHTQKVLIAKYRNQEGEMKYLATMGNDLLKQFKCDCGRTETVDLERRVM